MTQIQCLLQKPIIPLFPHPTRDDLPVLKLKELTLKTFFFNSNFTALESTNQLVSVQQRNQIAAVWFSCLAAGRNELTKNVCCRVTVKSPA